MFGFKTLVITALKFCTIENNKFDHCAKLTLKWFFVAYFTYLGSFLLDFVITLLHRVRTQF